MQELTYFAIVMEIHCFFLGGRLLKKIYLLKS